MRIGIDMADEVKYLYMNKNEVLHQLYVTNTSLIYTKEELVKSRNHATEQSNKLCASLGFNVLQGLMIIVLLFNIFS